MFKKIFDAGCRKISEPELKDPCYNINQFRDKI